jgi:DNA-directed RNA polymerase specialized sigma24 family protein
MIARAKLVVYFEGRRLSPSEDLADEVLFRTARKIGDGERVDDINRYIYGIARFVRLETFRRRETESVDGFDLITDRPFQRTPEQLKVMPVIYGDHPSSLEHRCLRTCLAGLPKENRDLILNYYEKDDSTGTHIEYRRSLAKSLGKSLGALQKQICLLRQKLGECTMKCVRDG